MAIKLTNLVVVFFSCGGIRNWMIDLETFKQTLLKNGITDLSEEQIIKLRDQQDQMAEMFFAMWRDEIIQKIEV